MQITAGNGYFLFYGPASTPDSFNTPALTRAQELQASMVLLLSRAVWIFTPCSLGKSIDLAQGTSIDPNI